MSTENTTQLIVPLSERTLIGCRLLAVLEICFCLGLFLFFDGFFGNSDRFASWPIHPFCIPVILASSYYGTREGLAAAILASLALLVGQLPEQRLNEVSNAWLLRAMYWPLIWSTIAITLGLIADNFRNRLKRIDLESRATANQLNSLTLAYQQSLRVNNQLETRVASQVCTVNAMYKASRAIERFEIGDVLVGVKELVVEVMQPSKFSLFLLNDNRLEAVLNLGWSDNENYQSEFSSSDTLFDAIVNHKQFLSVSNQNEIAFLRSEGLLAGPLINSETGNVIGMLKIENIEFRNLNHISIQNFRIVCEWISSSLGNAQRVQGFIEAQADVALTNQLLH